MVPIKARWEIDIMRTAGRLLAEVIEEVRAEVRPGVTTGELDAICEEGIRSRGAVPSFKGYRVGQAVFPASLCASINEEVVHGIPGDRVLQPGDVVSLDFGLMYHGYHADSAFTVALGPVPPRVQELLDVTERALYEAVRCARPGARLGDIGHRVQRICEGAGFGVIRDYVGHGIGRMLHEEPAVPNFGRRGTGLPLKPGMCIAIEPMITLGGWRTRVLDDGWTVVTRDGSTAAHFEHTVLITRQGPEILTRLAESTEGSLSTVEPGEPGEERT